MIKTWVACCSHTKAISIVWIQFIHFCSLLETFKAFLKLKKFPEQPRNSKRQPFSYVDNKKTTSTLFFSTLHSTNYLSCLLKPVIAQIIQHFFFLFPTCERKERRKRKLKKFVIRRKKNASIDGLKYFEIIHQSKWRAQFVIKGDRWPYMDQHRKCLINSKPLNGKI